MGAIAALLIAQSLILAGLFRLLATNSRRRIAEREVVRDCAAFAAMPPSARPAALRAMLVQDMHRDRFLALFRADGTLIRGNVAQIPPGATGFRRSSSTFSRSATTSRIGFARH